MHLRNLAVEDAPLMLEWMHNEEISGNFLVDFKSKTLSDCIAFINDSIDSNNIHFAIVDEQNMYMGTVSLKNIDGNQAEFAIAMRESAFGKGYAIYGMKSIIQYGFEKLGLKKIWWNVYKKNIRAIRFYDKHGWLRVDKNKITSELCVSGEDDCLWYLVEK